MRDNKPPANSDQKLAPSKSGAKKTSIVKKAPKPLNVEEPTE